MVFTTATAATVARCICVEVDVVHPFIVYGRAPILVVCLIVYGVVHPLEFEGR